MRKQLYWLNDAEWRRIKPLLPRVDVGRTVSMIDV